ncbi:hypothetical protein MA16_Dca011949 [Dendrobium catenatum]|uniref:Uncharacterized protein n=1 Tax=Dendrobium catenatum TaxID=906689 RepID=A0A2I0WDR3_9ASPA|nr:hypothetical protein MA16_Dca011949 [Dendrobium catenatum]
MKRCLEPSEKPGRSKEASQNTCLGFSLRQLTIALKSKEEKKFLHEYDDDFKRVQGASNYI